MRKIFYWFNIFATGGVSGDKNSSRTSYSEEKEHGLPFCYSIRFVIRWPNSKYWWCYLECLFSVAAHRLVVKPTTTTSPVGPSAHSMVPQKLYPPLPFPLLLLPLSSAPPPFSIFLFIIQWWMRFYSRYTMLSPRLWEKCICFDFLLLNILFILGPGTSDFTLSLVFEQILGQLSTF